MKTVRDTQGSHGRSDWQIGRVILAVALAWSLMYGPVMPTSLGAAQQSNQTPRVQECGDREAQTGFEKRPSSDIVAENLARVAASAEQILGVLNKVSGLMMEFMTLYAQQAGLQGQLLEEADLTDSAISDKLRQDVRLRLLATKLLQRYGYLLPRLNPDSDLAEERMLLLRQKAQERGVEPPERKIESPVRAASASSRATS